MSDAVVTLKEAFALIDGHKRLKAELELARAVVAAARLTIKRGGLNTYGLALGLTEHLEAYDERYPEENAE